MLEQLTTKQMWREGSKLWLMQLILSIPLGYLIYFLTGIIGLEVGETGMGVTATWVSAMAAAQIYYLRKKRKHPGFLSKNGNRRLLKYSTYCFTIFAFVQIIVAYTMAAGTPIAEMIESGSTLSGVISSGIFIPLIVSIGLSILHIGGYALATHLALKALLAQQSSASKSNVNIAS